MKQPTPWWMWLLPLPVVWWAALLTAGAWQPGMDLLQLMAGLSTVLQRPWDIRWTQYSGRCLLLFTLAYAVGIGMALSNTTATRRGEEHGSARWGDVFSIARRYRDKRGGNLILTEGVGIYGETPEDYLCRMETLGELMAVLDTCTEAQRRRFLLYALDGLSFSEIAALCGCSKSSVQGSIEAVRKIFKKILRNHPYE